MTTTDDQNTPHPTIWAMAATQNGLDVVRLALGRLPITGVIGLAPRDATDAISGLVDARPFCDQHQLRHAAVNTYSLSDAQDQALLQSLDIGVLLVVGWQRLIPQWLIDHTKVAALGVHGSAGGITAGRGRSPQNWSILLGCDSFSVSVFYVDAGIDSGNVLDTTTFPLTPHDDIRTSHLKVSIATVDMLEKAWTSGRLLRKEGDPQPDHGARYMPQRKPEDGMLDFNLPSEEVCRFVRALTRPYPGAYCHTTSNNTLKVWRARPLDGVATDHPAKPGTITAILASDELIVRTATGSVLIDDWTLETESGEPLATIVPERDEQLIFADAGEQIARVIERHTTSYPDLPLSLDIERYAAQRATAHGATRP